MELIVTGRKPATPLADPVAPEREVATQINLIVTRRRPIQLQLHANRLQLKSTRLQPIQFNYN